MQIVSEIITSLLLATSAKATNIEPNPGGLTLFAVLFILLGLVSVVFPKAFWHMRIGRKVPHVKPSKLYLGMLRFGGLLVVALGIYLLLFIRQNF